MRGTGDFRRGAPDRRPDPKRRQRAEELVASGMPVSLASAVAAGKVSLNDALLAMARRTDVQRLVDKHGLSRAVATQVVLGQVGLEVVLERKRMDAHLADHRERSVLDEFARSRAPITLLLHGRRRVTGVVHAVDTYNVRFVDEAGTESEIHKLQIKLAYAPDSYKRFRKVARIDKAFEGQGTEPILRPQDRYACSDRRLFRYLDRHESVQITLLEGDQFVGEIGWLSRFVFGVRLKGDAEVVVFRHALADLRES